MHSFTLRRTTILGVAAAALAALFIAAMGHDALAGAKDSKTKLTCTLRTVDVAPTAPNGEDFGVVRCSRLLGTGVQHNTSKRTMTSPTTGTFKGTAKLFFDEGTVRADFTLEFSISGNEITFTGNAKVTGGTGAYKGAGGTVKLSGTSSDGGTHSTITEKVTLTLP